MRMILCKMLVGISLISYTPLLHILVHTRSPMHHLTLPKRTNEQNQNLCLRGKKKHKSLMKNLVNIPQIMYFYYY